MDGWLAVSVLSLGRSKYRYRQNPGQIKEAQFKSYESKKM